MRNDQYIFIISNEEDSTTDDVIDWLKHWSIPFKRVNPSNLLDVNIINASSEGFSFSLENKQISIDFDKIKSYWYRRGKIRFNFTGIEKLQNEKLQKACNDSIASEYTDLNNFIYPLLEEKHGIGSIYHNTTNKVINLYKANQVGLNIPKTIITTKKSQLIEFLNRYKNVITKPIGQAGLIYTDNEINIDGTTAKVDIEKALKLPEYFPISLFQNYVEKAYEVRVFYLDGKCYSSAIFSQLDEQTKVDFRNYNYTRPNRTPPYKLPENIERKIDKFMNSVNMISGSIDLIVTSKKEYYFLEVNPIGQFYQVSYPCNYFLEKKIALYLSNNVNYE